MVLPTALRDDFITAKFLNDFSCPGFEQAALARYMEDGGFERHLRVVRKELKARHKELMAGLRQHAGDRVEVVDSPAGMHVVVWFRDYNRAQAEALLELAASRGLGMYGMAPHYLNPPVRQGVMLGYCGLSITELRDAMKLFGACMNEIDARKPVGVSDISSSGV
jgi:GntR family transcriptional regulator/MocR family aminotransferase